MFKFACSLIILLALSPVTAMMSDGDEGHTSQKSSALPQEEEKTHYWFLNIPERGLVEGRCSKRSAEHLELEMKSTRAWKARHETLKKEHKELELEILEKDGGGEEGVIPTTSLSSEAKKKHELEAELRKVNFDDKYYQALTAKYQWMLQYYICIPDDTSSIRQRGIDANRRQLVLIHADHMNMGLLHRRWRLQDELAALSQEDQSKEAR